MKTKKIIITIIFFLQIDLDNWENVRIERPWEETDGK